MRTARILSIIAVTAVLARVALPAAVTTVPEPSSRTGFTTTFTYADAEASDARILGGFHFYRQGDPRLFAGGLLLPASDSMENYVAGPSDWEPGAGLKHMNGAGAVLPMAEEDGVWSVSVDLPGGFYPYQVQVSYDGGMTYSAIADPDNEPWINAIGGSQSRSLFYVPYDERQQDRDNYDWSWAMPMEDESKRGSVSSFRYQGVGGEQTGMIYLPAGYDPLRPEPYKVLYMSHGGYGDVGDWFYQANVGCILDHLVADGVTEEFVIVTMHNQVYETVFPAELYVTPYNDNPEFFYTCYWNIMNYLIPYVEANYNVSAEASGKAFAGLSNGGKQATVMYILAPEEFGYFGMFSGSAAWLWPDLDDYSAYKEAKVYLGGGFADFLLMHRSYNTGADKTVIGLKDKLDASGITYNGGRGVAIVDGSHDWFTWPLLARDYFAGYLWK